MPVNEVLITGKTEGINPGAERWALAGLCSHDREAQGSWTDMIQQVTDAEGEAPLINLRLGGTERSTVEEEKSHSAQSSIVHI